MDYISDLGVCQSPVTLIADRPAVSRGCPRGCRLYPSLAQTLALPGGAIRATPSGSTGPQKPLTALGLSLSASSNRPPMPPPGSLRSTVPRPHTQGASSRPLPFRPLADRSSLRYRAGTHLPLLGSLPATSGRPQHPSLVSPHCQPRDTLPGLSRALPPKKGPGRGLAEPAHHRPAPHDLARSAPRLSTRGLGPGACRPAALTALGGMWGPGALPLPLPHRDRQRKQGAGPVREWRGRGAGPGPGGARGAGPKGRRSAPGPRRAGRGRGGAGRGGAEGRGFPTRRSPRRGAVRSRGGRLCRA